MKKILSLSFLFFLNFTCYSQVVQFTKLMPIPNHSAMNNFQQTSDGGYILSTDEIPLTSINVERGFLVKMDAQGSTQWIKSYPKVGGLLKTEDGNSVFQTRDGGYIIGTAQYFNVAP